MPAPPLPAPRVTVRAHATPNGLLLEVCSSGVSMLAALTLEQAEGLVASLQGSASTTRAMLGDEGPNTEGSPEQ